MELVVEGSHRIQIEQAPMQVINPGNPLEAFEFTRDQPIRVSVLDIAECRERLAQRLHAIEHSSNFLRRDTALS